MRQLTRSALTALAILLTTNACAAPQAFWVSNGKLMRGTKAFTCRAIHTPELAQSTAQISEMVPAFVRTGEVGGTALWYDLPGLSQDGTTIDPTTVATITAIGERAKDTRLAIILRVPGPDGDPEFRRKATETAAEAFKQVPSVLYWFDGEDGPALAKAFKKRAPKCVTLAAKNGDIRVTTDATPKGGQWFLRGAIPTFKDSDTHCLIDGGEAGYAAMEEGRKTDIERAPWTPDNSVLTQEERDEGFIALFNGKDLSGWWLFGDIEDGFRVKDNAIEWVREGGGALMSHDRYDNFILRFEYRVDKEDGNSGVFIRAPRAARQSKLGMEFQLRGDHGKEPGTGQTGAVYDVLPALTNPSKPNGEWNSVEITFNGPHLHATLNGTLIQDVNFDEHEELKHRLRRGFIGLQDHNSPSAWRNIRIKPLP